MVDLATSSLRLDECAVIGSLAARGEFELVVMKRWSLLGVSF